MVSSFPGSADGRLRQPGYDPDAVTVGIVHFGVGGFHRSHLAVYTDDQLAEGARDWGICGVGTQPGDRRMAEVLRAQDHRYALLIKHADGGLSARVVGSIRDYLFAPDDPEAVIRRLADPATRIVSLTITEGGYPVNPVSGVFDPVDEALRLDLEPQAVPRSVFGLIVEGLRRRRDAGIAPFTVMSCDNMRGNGDVTRTSVVGFATLKDPALGAWIGSSVTFPNAMVDRITPVTTDEDRALLLDRFGRQDAWPVVCEPFTQWVLEDDFPLGRPTWERGGAQLVADVAPYELLKLRLLNAGHQVLCYLGYLAGYRYVDEVCADPVFAQFLGDYLTEEALASLAGSLASVGSVAAEYPATLLARFGNPHIRDTLARLCCETSDRIPAFLLPVIRDRLAAGGDTRRATLAVAAWARYAEGTDDHGAPIEIADRLLDTVREAVLRQQVEPAGFLTHTALFGELADSPVFRADFFAAWQSLRTHGARESVARLLGG